MEAGDIALLIIRSTLGLFYVLARFRFFYDPAGGGSLPAEPLPMGFTGTSAYNDRKWLNPRRFASLRRKMQHCGINYLPGAWAWFAAIVEVFGGLLLILGVWSRIMAVLLLGVSLAATRCTWRQKVFEQNPVDCIDVCACYLWRVEGLYIIMALVITISGGGAIALN